MSEPDCNFIDSRHCVEMYQRVQEMESSVTALEYLFLHRRVDITLPHDGQTGSESGTTGFCANSSVSRLLFKMSMQAIK